MSDELRDVIVVALTEKQDADLGIPFARGRVAAAIVSVVKSAGYEIVKLPKPDESSEHFVRFGDHWVDKRDGTITWHHHKVHGDLRAMALECLAAANAADAADGAR